MIIISFNVLPASFISKQIWLPHTAVCVTRKSFLIPSGWPTSAPCNRSDFTRCFIILITFSVVIVESVTFGCSRLFFFIGCFWQSCRPKGFPLGNICNGVGRGFHVVDGLFRVDHGSEESGRHHNRRRLAVNAGSKWLVNYSSRKQLDWNNATQDQESLKLVHEL